MSVKPIFFALDGKELSEFTETLEKLKGVIYGVKVGLEMFTAEGPSSVEKLKNDGWKNLKFICFWFSASVENFDFWSNLRESGS